VCHYVIRGIFITVFYGMLGTDLIPCTANKEILNKNFMERLIKVSKLQERVSLKI
jgi:hypothetical protein